MASFYRQLADLLRQNGWERERSAKGGHELWAKTGAKKKLTVPYDCNMRHTANGILKDAGIKVKL